MDDACFFFQKGCGRDTWPFFFFLSNFSSLPVDVIERFYLEFRIDKLAQVELCLLYIEVEFRKKKTKLREFSSI